MRIIDYKDYEKEPNYTRDTLIYGGTIVGIIAIAVLGVLIKQLFLFGFALVLTVGALIVKEIKKYQ